LAHVVAEDGRQPGAELQHQLGGVRSVLGVLDKGRAAAPQILLRSLDVDRDGGLGDAVHRPGHHPEQLCAGRRRDLARRRRPEEPGDEHRVVVGELGGIDVGYDHAEVAVDPDDVSDVEREAVRQVAGGERDTPVEDQVGREPLGLASPLGRRKFAGRDLLGRRAMGREPIAQRGALALKGVVDVDHPPQRYGPEGP
jgi:hypothetical protein